MTGKKSPGAGPFDFANNEYVNRKSTKEWDEVLASCKDAEERYVVIMNIATEGVAEVIRFYRPAGSEKTP